MACGGAGDGFRGFEHFYNVYLVYLELPVTSLAEKTTLIVLGKQKFCLVTLHGV